MPRNLGPPKIGKANRINLGSTAFYGIPYYSQQITTQKIAAEHPTDPLPKRNAYVFITGVLRFFMMNSLFYLDGPHSTIVAISAGKPSGCILFQYALLWNTLRRKYRYRAFLF